MTVVFRHDLDVDILTDTLPCSAVVEPAVEGALHASIVLDLSAHSQMSAHVQAVSLEDEYLALVGSENN